MTYRSSLFVILISLYLMLPTSVLAQDATPSGDVGLPTTGINLTISPPLLNITTEPGATFSAVLKIKNNNSAPEAIRIDIMKFVADDTGGRPKIIPLDIGDTFPQWMNFSETEFIVPGQTWKTIDFTFQPPANASPAYYFAIVFKRQRETTVEEGFVSTGAPAILGLAKVSSSRVYHQVDLNQLDADTIGFTTDHYIYEFLPVNFEVSLANNGNVHELVYGNIFVDWLTGHKTDVAILDVNKDKSFILPQTKRTFYSSWADGFPVWQPVTDAAGAPVLNKKGKPVRKLHWDLQKLTSFRIGKYQGSLLVIYNDGVRDIPIEAQTSFWVIPWRILLAILVILILILIGFKNTLQHLYEKTKRRSPPPQQ